MRAYKNYDISENNLQRFLSEISSMQCEIKGSSLIREGWWRLLMFVDQSDEEMLDRLVRSFGFIGVVDVSS